MIATIQALDGLLFVIILIAQPLIMFIWRLLSPDWTFWDIISLRPVLHTMWIYISNIVYFIFAIMLIAMALMNIFGEKNKDFWIRASLPRLVIGVIMVPFTWFIVSATLSVSNILTAAVISIPFETITNNSAQGTNPLENIMIPKNILVDLTETWTWSSIKNTGEISLKDFLSSQNWAYNLLPAYAYGIFKIQDAKIINDNTALDTIKTTGDIFKKLTFGTLFAIIFCVLIIAIAFALFTRMWMLWIYAMFSPVFALTFFLHWKWWESAKKLEKYVNIKTFISLALVPVYVSAALSFWLMFISVAQNNIKQTWSNNKSLFIFETCPGNAGWSCQTISTGDDKNKSFSLSIKWNWTGKWKEATTSDWSGTFDVFWWMISNIIINFIALIVLRMAVMAALWASEITNKAIKPIADFWDSMWKLMLDAPKYIPLKIPGKDGKSIGISMLWLPILQSEIKSHFDSTAQKQARDFADGIWMQTDKFLKASDEYTTKVLWADIWDWAKAGWYLTKVKAVKPIDDIMTSEVDKKKFVTSLAGYMFTDAEKDKKDKFIKDATGKTNSIGLANVIKNSWARATVITWTFWSIDETDIVKSLNSWSPWAKSEPNTNPKPTLATKDLVKKNWDKIEINVNWAKDWKPININIAQFKHPNNTYLSDTEIVDLLKKDDVLKYLEEWDINKIRDSIKAAIIPKPSN